MNKKILGKAVFSFLLMGLLLLLGACSGGDETSSGEGTSDSGSSNGDATGSLEVGVRVIMSTTSMN